MLDPLAMLMPPPVERPLRPALFIDKDGTLIENVPYNADPALLRFMPGAGEALTRLQRTGIALVIVTNQSGLARGYFTRAQFARLQQALLQRLQQEFGVAIDGFEVCPHAAGAEGRPGCLCRKPAPGMLIRAAHRHGLDLSRSWMVGDILDDVEAGHRAGAGGLLFDSGGETTWRRSPLREPDAVFTDWAAVADHIEQALQTATGDARWNPHGTAPSNASTLNA
ncbi:D-glycero-alpha-D-manno-heptose-1,7-bisphosphate 7-phosphatase [Roseateles cellulosilyticus]|uniref:D-glycero-alpha-D-manno-heptose-1,7-bisphosphate 7-phosphatase n=1 Tax=Pelomonas cellulosilytica TaxID=2906762 RepID=UPI001F43C058